MNNSGSRFLFKKYLFGAACLTVAALSLLPAKHLPPVAFDVWDKAQHALGFAVLTGLGLWAYSAKRRALVLGLLIYGAAIECAQSATGWRHGDWQDFLADATGVLLVYLVRVASD